jgi:TPR repeat protein
VKLGHGENILLEWEREKFPDELRQALDLIKTDVSNSLVALHRLAEMGSILSMVYLGGIYLHGKHSVDRDTLQGEALLREAFENGSIEGGYILTHSLFSGGNVKDAVSIFHELSDREYSPAQFVLGRLYHNGEVVEKDAARGMYFIEKASKNGHFFAKSGKYEIEYSEKKCFIYKIFGSTMKIILIARAFPFLLLNQRSDRFRR